METQHTNSSSSQPEDMQSPQRPTPITVICVLGFIGAVITLPLIFSNLAARIGTWYPPYLGFSAIVGLVCMIGLWKMKKWAAYTYIAFAAINQIVLFSTSTWNVFSLIIPGIVVAIMLTHLNKMN